MAASVDRLSEGLDRYVESGKRTPEFRQRVRALAEGQWGEPVVAHYLGDVGPVFDVPGRRKDGTVKGKRLVRRFFWNVFRGVGNVLVNAVTIFGGGVGDAFAGSRRRGHPRQNGPGLGRYLDKYRHDANQE